MALEQVSLSKPLKITKLSLTYKVTLSAMNGNLCNSSPRHCQFLNPTSGSRAYPTLSNCVFSVPPLAVHSSHDTLLVHVNRHALYTQAGLRLKYPRAFCSYYSTLRYVRAIWLICLHSNSTHRQEVPPQSTRKLVAPRCYVTVSGQCVRARRLIAC